MGTTNVAVILAFRRREVGRGILNYVSSTRSHLTLTKVKNMLSFPVGVENEQLRSTLVKTILFQDFGLRKYRFFYVIHLI